MSEPNPYESPQTYGVNTTSFRSGFLVVYSAIAVFALGLGIPCRIFFNGHLHGLGIAVGAALALTAVLTALGCALMKVYIVPTGVRGYDIWSRYRTVAWHQITGTRTIGVGYLKYVRVFTDDGRSPLWIPLFLANQAKFVELLRELAEPSNPLVEFFDAGVVRTTK